MIRKKDVLTWLLILAILFAIIGAGIYAMWPQIQQHTTIHLGDGVFTTRVAKTQDEREKGLSGTRSLRDDQAMLFVFDRDDKWPIWMKGMNYPIDIVWLNKDKHVVYIVKNAPPESYPYDQFVPKQDARYVIELAAGTVVKKTISTEDIAEFDENNLEGIKL
jgi:uncharacterized membrane protein (UPF0127 family)